MDGSLVTVLILLILDLAICVPSSRKPKKEKDTENIEEVPEHALKAYNLDYDGMLEEYENIEEVPDYALKSYDLDYDGMLKEYYDNNEGDSSLLLKEVNFDERDDDEDGDAEDDLQSFMQEACHDENGCEETLSGRSLKVGDTFTPQEMLPIAKQLMEKVAEPGKGKGIISSATHPQALADTLYETYFGTMKRIIRLKRIDLSGLDALQALALSGKVVKTDEYETLRSITESPKNIYGETTNENTDVGPERCKYKVLTKHNDDVPGDGLKNKLKVAPTGKNKLIRGRKFSIRELANKKLGKKRKLIIKGTNRRRNQRLKMKRNKLRRKMRKNKERRKGQRKSTSAGGKINHDALKSVKNCRWRYECENPADQRTCHVSPDCTSNKTDSYIGVKGAENSKALQDFRRMVRIESVDEEVEKILERQTLSVNKIVKDELKIESIGEYFERLMRREKKKATRSTKPMPNTKKRTRNTNYIEMSA